MRLLTLLVILGTSVAGTQPASSIQILEAGEHHGGEVPADAAGNWFALVDGAGGPSLRRVRVSVVTVKDEIVDEGDEMTGKRVDVSPAVEPMILLRGVRGLKAGRVATALIDAGIDTEQGITTRLGDRTYDFYLHCHPLPPVEGQLQDRCDLMLRSSSIEQVLFSYGAYYEGNDRIWSSEDQPRVVWAGDLNGDGALDVLLNTSDHYNVDETRLYLSTAEGSSVLVKEVAVHTMTGC